MISEPRKPFNRRAFAALTMAISGLGLPLTGYMNHYYQMSPLTLARHAWMSAHDILGVIFAIFAIWHVILNRCALGNHLWGGLGKIKRIGRETIAAFSLIAILLLFFVGHAFHVH